MQLIRGLQNLTQALTGCVATIGNFDGLHRGHQYLLAEVERQAKSAGLPSVLVTFEPQPLEYFKPAIAPARLTTLREKALVLSHMQLDHLVCLHFDARLASLTAREFVQQLLIERLGLRSLVIGDDFRFGRGRDGDHTTLKELGAEFGYTVTAMDTHDVGTERVSSTRVREALAAGDLQAAAALLGRPFSHVGRVIHGEKRGRDLGVPTLNMDLKRLQSPLQGVFATRVHRLADTPLPAISYIGTRPVFNGRKLLLETHIFDFDADCYGRLIEIEFVERVRGDRNFDSADELVKQMHIDMDNARQRLGRAE
ncbi:riboflavin kinase/FMN adenylyltransferase [Methylohalomonas lacus]|uniref:Riboflavin biosynthesis protein n=1 Tax=Methylohalomonas lacus TaxID=398773 RepID=A0AAE3L597_9GAMM|nr:bifunctional riboflavin kinase/FAD synthetase [Methylohalomonas lacus]MCS3902952.1 riboflavin kinase/FMN adenylyltransferase [Methylohalomonas lacus]